MWPLDSSLFNVTFIVGLILFCVYRYMTVNFNYWRDHGIPYRKPLFFFGNYKDFLLMRSNMGAIYKDIYKEFYNEKMVGVFKTRRLDLMINDPDIIKHVLVKDFHHFHDRFGDHSENLEPLTANLFSSKGNQWRTVRYKMTPIFTSGKLKNMFPLIVEKGEEFQKYLTSELKGGEMQEVRELMARFTTDVIGSCAFGVTMNSMSDTNAPFRQVGRKIFESSTMKTCKVFLRAVSPPIFHLFKLRVTDVSIDNFLISTVKEILAERRDAETKRHDFIDLMLDMKKQGFLVNEKKFNTKEARDNENIDVDDIFITAQAFIFFAAGFETSSGLMSFALNELALHQDVQEKLLNEIDSVVKKNDGKLTYDGILEMHYLELVISETLRKYPALGVLTRVCNQTYPIPGSKYVLEKDITVAIPVQAIHYDPKYYPEPEKFIPERFTAEAKKERHPMVYLPFGEGPRNCIGLRFGKIQSMVGLVSFLMKFKVEPCEKTQVQVELDPRAFVTCPKDGIWLTVKSRKKEH